MRIGIVGGRDFNDYNMLKSALSGFKDIDLVVSGGAIGADILGEIYALENDIETLIHYPDWEEFGKRAGFIRNSEIVNDSDLIIAFWDNKSKGTKDTIDKCYEMDKSIIVINYSNDEYSNNETKISLLTKLYKKYKFKHLFKMIKILNNYESR